MTKYGKITQLILMPLVFFVLFVNSVFIVAGAALLANQLMESGNTFVLIPYLPYIAFGMNALVAIFLFIELGGKKDERRDEDN